MQINKQAFTLIELLVVVLIIGILAAVAVPQYQLAVWKSRLATIKNITKSIANAEEIYYLENNAYTHLRENLDIDMPSPISSQKGVNRSIYTYDWGFCELMSAQDETIYNAKVTCTLDNNSNMRVGYAMQLKHASFDAGNTMCISNSANLKELSNRLCASDTGKNRGWLVDDTYYQWTY